MTKFPVVTIVGSMRFYERMIELAGELTCQRNIVLMPHRTYGEAGGVMLEKLHQAKMDMSVAIYVVTNSEMYVGVATAGEIEYAKNTGLAIHWDILR